MDRRLSPRRIALWKVAAIVHAQFEALNLGAALRGWRHRAGAASAAIERRRIEDAKWAQWVCDCLDSKNGLNPFMLD